MQLYLWQAEGLSGRSGILHVAEMKLDVTSLVSLFHHLFSKHSPVSSLIYGAVSGRCYSSVIFSTALFLQPTANPSPSPGCRTILNHVLRSEIPSSCQTPFLILSTPTLHLSRLLGEFSCSESSLTSFKINSDLQHHVFSIMPFF